jgi:hypothetical protein
MDKWGGIALLIPIFGIVMPFLTAIVIVGLVAYTKNRARKDMQETIRLAIDKGQPLPTEMIEAMTRSMKPPSSAQRDLRFGIIWLAVGIGIALFGSLMAINDHDDVFPALAFGAIPATAGVALIILSYFNPNKSDKPQV